MPLKTVETKTAEQQQPRAPFGAPHAFVLVLADSTDPRDVYRIAQRETLLGRGDEAHLTLNGDSVSRCHCSIRVDASACFVTDLGSRNGTTINDRPLRPGVAQRLRHLDELCVGDTRILFLTGRMREAPRRV